MDFTTFSAEEIIQNFESGMTQFCSNPADEFSSNASNEYITKYSNKQQQGINGTFLFKNVLFQTDLSFVTYSYEINEDLEIILQQQVYTNKQIDNIFYQNLQGEQLPNLNTEARQIIQYNNQKSNEQDKGGSKNLKIIQSHILIECSILDSQEKIIQEQAAVKAIQDIDKDKNQSKKLLIFQDDKQRNKKDIQ